MKRLFISVLIGLIVSGIAIGQAESVKIDEFGKMPDCEFKARTDALFIGLGNNEGSQAYVIIYRGIRSAPGRYDDSVFDAAKRRFEWVMTFRKYDQSRVVIIDGGFRDIDSIWNEFWIVMPGAVPPIATETVARPTVLLTKTFLADRSWIWLEGAGFQSLEPEDTVDDSSIYEEMEALPEPDLDPVSEAEPEGVFEEDDEDSFFDSDPDDYIRIRSSYWEGLLAKNADARGVLIFYADPEEYDIGKAKLLMEDDLRKWVEKTGLDLKRVDIIFGGFRKSNDLEFWFVPKGGDAPVPTPETNPEPLPSD
jgi:hypothetical protein